MKKGTISIQTKIKTKKREKAISDAIHKDVTIAFQDLILSLAEKKTDKK